MSTFKHIESRVPPVKSSPKHLTFSKRWIAATALLSSAIGAAILTSEDPRSLFKKLGIAGLLGSVGVAMLGSAQTTALEINHLYLNQQQFARAELTIAQLSDFHLGSKQSQIVTQKAIDAIHSQQPDLILLTGDFLNELDDIHILPNFLEKLNAPLGIYACLGNHDYWEDPILIAETLDSIGIKPLINEHRVLEHRGYRFILAGVADPWCGVPDLSQALEGSPKGAPIILMAHCPDFFDDAIQADLILQLSGHTHAGHISLPLLGPLVLPHYGTRYYRGLYTQANSHLYVNRGLAGLPLRLGAKPEVTFIHIKSL